MAALLPLVSWLTFGFARPSSAYLDVSLYAFAAGSIALAGALLTVKDRWLGLFVVAAAVLAVVHRQTIFYPTMVLFGAGIVVGVREAAQAGWGPFLRAVLVGAACVQAVIALGQVLLWRPEWAAGTDPLALAFGTFGNSKYLGLSLALVTPLAPLWAVPVLAIGLGLSQSALACLAAIAGLLARPGVGWRWRGLAASLGAMALGVTLFVRTLALDTAWSRLNVWHVAFADWTWWSLLVGHGPGAWFGKRFHIPTPSGWLEVFPQAHSEPVQLGYELGLVGLVLLAAWLWSYRRALQASPWRGAAIAMAVMVSGWHIFHNPMLAVPAAVVLGLATAEAAC